MAKKLVQALLLFAVVGLFTGVGFASQVTLADSPGNVTFTGTSTGANISFHDFGGKWSVRRGVGNVHDDNNR